MAPLNPTVPTISEMTAMSWHPVYPTPTIIRAGIYMPVEGGKMATVSNASLHVSCTEPQPGLLWIQAQTGRADFRLNKGRVGF